MKTDLKISYPGSKKVYVNGAIHPSVRVGMRMVKQMPTVSIKDGRYNIDDQLAEAVII